MNDTEPACTPSKSAPARGVEGPHGHQHDDTQMENHETPGCDGTADRDDDRADRPDDSSNQPREIGGRKGPDPVRYGDWEKNGRCIDF